MPKKILKREPAANVPLWYELYGGYGVIAILLAYFLNSYQIIEIGIVYYLLNLTGSIGIAAVSFRRKAWAPTILNIAWGLIALGAILKEVWT